MEFNAIKKIRLHHEGEFFDVPSTKSEIFNSQYLNLEEKQKLLNYIYATIKVACSEVDVNATVDFGKDIEVESKYIELVKSILC
jgi:RAB protein geranylgeranyltransferase component A